MKFRYKNPVLALKFDGDISSVSALIPRDTRVLTGTGCARLEFYSRNTGYEFTPEHAVDLKVGQWLVAQGDKVEVWSDSTVQRLLEPETSPLSEFLKWIGPMGDDERLAAFWEIHKTYCKNCGEQKKAECHCMNDE